MKHSLNLILLVALVGSARAQLATQSIPSEQDQRDLFARAAASRLVIIGAVVKSEGRSETLSTEAILERMRKGADYRASLFTIQVNEIVCRQSDFDAKVPKIDDKPSLVYVLIPFDESGLPDGHYREKIFSNGHYLLLLTEVETEALSPAYKLDPNQTYYRGEGHNRGVIPLGQTTSADKLEKAPEVVDKFRRLCAAMRPPSPADKLVLLQELADSDDPILQKEAEIAKTAVKASMQNENVSQPPRSEPR
jgi:hypothetical protein